MAKGLSNGNGFSRLLVAVVTVLNVAGGIWIAVSQSSGSRWSGVGTILLGLIVLAILYSPRSNAFFRTN